jgi:hypothetical protein
VSATLGKEAVSGSVLAMAIRYVRNCRRHSERLSSRVGTRFKNQGCSTHVAGQGRGDRRRDYAVLIGQGMPSGLVSLQEAALWPLSCGPVLLDGRAGPQPPISD